MTISQVRPERRSATRAGQRHPDGDRGAWHGGFAVCVFPFCWASPLGVVPAVALIGWIGISAEVALERAVMAVRGLVCLGY